MEEIHAGQIDQIRLMHHQDEAGRTVAKILDTDLGKKFMEILFHDLVIAPRDERILSNEPKVSEGILAYNMGKSDAYYRIAKCGEEYSKRAEQLGEVDND